VTHPLGYDPVEASRERWIQQGWEDVAPGMAAVVSVMRAEQIFLRRATDTLRPLGLTFARYQVLGMARWAGPLTLGAIGHGLWITPATVTNAIDRWRLRSSSDGSSTPRTPAPRSSRSPRRAADCSTAPSSASTRTSSARSACQGKSSTSSSR
jgi:hypothetical protein